MKTIGKALMVSGKVQGVGFRQWAQSEALKLGLTGWVCNEFNGWVFIHIEGDEESVFSYVKVCKQGPFGAKVSRVLDNNVEPGYFKKFGIRGYLSVGDSPVELLEPSQHEKMVFNSSEKLLQEFIYHSQFGDTTNLYNRLLTFYDKVTNTLAKYSLPIRELYTAFSISDHTRLIICSDPVFRSLADTAISHYYLSETPDLDKLELLAKTILKKLNGGERKLSSLWGKRVDSNTDIPGNNLWQQITWTPEGEINEFSFSDYFSRAFKNELANGVSSEEAVLREVDKEGLKMIQLGKSVLDQIIPELSKDILKHVRVIGLIDKASSIYEPMGVRLNLCQNVSTHKIPGSIFLSPTPFRHAVHMAEALFHEGLHKKLSNIVSTMHIFEAGFSADDSPTVKAYWNPDLSWNSNDWSLDRALYALHFYLHNSYFYLQISGCLSSLKETFNVPSDLDIRKTYDKSVERAKYLASELTLHSSSFDEDGKKLINWMKECVNLLTKI